MMQVSGISKVKSYEYNAAAPASRRSKETEDCLKRLRKSHPELNIQIADIENREDIKDASRSSQGMYNVVIDSSLLQKMAEDEEVYKQYEGILTGIVKTHEMLKKQKELSGRKVVSVTTVIDKDGSVSNCVASSSPPKEPLPLITASHSKDSPLERFQHSNKKGKFAINYKFDYGSNMTKLAQAKSIQNVRGVIRTQYAEISRAKGLIEDKAEAAVTVRRIKAIIAKAGLKISRLHKEEFLEQRQNIAEKKFKQELARELAEKLRSKRMARKGEEHCNTIDMNGVLEKSSHSRYEYAVNMYQMGFDISGSTELGSAPAIGGAGAAPEVSIDISV